MYNLCKVTCASEIYPINTALYSAYNILAESTESLTTSCGLEAYQNSVKNESKEERNAN